MNPPAIVRGARNLPRTRHVSRVLINQPDALASDESEPNDYFQSPDQSSNHGLANRTNDSIYLARSDRDTRLEEELSLNEVYLFDCCGLTRELKPANEYMNIFKKFFYLFNVLVFLFGFATFGMGLWFRIDPKVYEIHKYIETQNYTIAGWIMLFGGFLACIVALLGCMATRKYDLSLLVCYLITLMILLLASVATTIMLTIHGLGLSLEMFLIRELYEQIRRRVVNTEMALFASNEAIHFMDFVQVKVSL